MDIFHEVFTIDTFSLDGLYRRVGKECCNTSFTEISTHHLFVMLLALSINVSNMVRNPSKNYSVWLLKGQQEKDNQAHQGRCNLSTGNEIAAVFEDSKDGCPPSNREV